MRLLILPLTCLAMAACQGGEDKAVIDAPANSANAVEPVNIAVPLDGQVTISVEPLVSEMAACIIPLRVSNGLDEEITVFMSGFKVTGDGEDDTGNMFGQATPSGEYRTSRIIQIGQNCDAFDTITPQAVQCKQASEEACEVVFESSPEIEFAEQAE